MALSKDLVEEKNNKKGSTKFVNKQPEVKELIKMKQIEEDFKDILNINDSSDDEEGNGM